MTAQTNLNGKTIFFDLDGTLLEMHTEEFVQNYLKELAKYVGDRMDAKQLIGLLWEATKAMIQSDEPEMTNEEVFVRYFLTHSGLEKDAIWPVFEAFYSEIFPTLSHLTNPSPWGKKIVEAAKEQGFRVAVTTNPVFPKEAIYSRLGWLGLTPDEFELVTVYEEAHYTKPNLGYYQEVCDKLGVKPEDCIMVGNHMQEDMVAGELGLKTFLVTNYMENRGEPLYRVDQQGTFEDVYNAIVNRTGVFAP
ncbi:HAD family hydrolase [Brevibacillus dissolubilis]|uniref:HAD family hydrolase n=1 Tax=Brevibacillus dissolubilis TaxID=1844116 RepID=UPI001115C458|nr:HAD family hydrolase [Brevibacillus dissolubilis]